MDRKKKSLKLCISSWIFFSLMILVAIHLPFHSLAQKPVVENVQYNLKDDHIEITYDLVGNPYKNYKVTVALKRESDPGFIFFPAEVIGDVGKGWFAGENRKIIWNYRNEFKPDPNASDYYFEISAKKPGHAWVYILSGAIVAGTGAAVYFMTREKSEDPGPKFPIPVRP